MNGCKVLVVEDEAIIAMSLEDILADAGFDIAGPVGSVAGALALIAREPDIGCALLDVNLRGETVYAVADALDGRGVPFAFTSGYGADGIDARFSDRPVLLKPVDPKKLVSFVEVAANGR